MIYSMEEKLISLIKRILPTGADFEIFIPENGQFGHYSTNAALRLAQVKHQEPRKIAEDLARKIMDSDAKEFIEKVEVAGPGFINFWLKPEFLLKEFGKLVKNKNFPAKSKEGKGKAIVVDYSSPNIAKPMHVGHLRSTIIGDAIANIYEFLGYKVIRSNYLGDWGTQFGKLIAAYRMWGNKKAVEKNPIGELLELYIRFHKEMEKNPKLEDLGREEFQKLESGNSENKKLWKWFREESLKEFNKIYKILNVEFTETIGESDYEKQLNPLVDGLLKKKIAKISKGAAVIPLKGQELPALLRKADGASLYLTRDLANILVKIKKYKPEKILYVVANEQTLHFEQLFAVAKILGIKKTNFYHVKFGLVQGEDGKKLKTREGDIIYLEELVQKLVQLAYKVVDEKNPDLNVEEKAKIAETIGIAALKYNDLMENRNSDIAFNWEKMLDIRGDSAPYLLYAYSRLKSILRKAAKTRINADRNADLRGYLTLVKEEELALVRKIFDFPSAVGKVAEGFLPNYIANYLYNLANLANQFYESTPIIKDENAARRNARLVLITATAEILKKGLNLLGIKEIERI